MNVCDTNVQILEGWKQVAAYLGYSERHVRRLFQKISIAPQYWLGPKHRMRMTTNEADLFMIILKKKTPPISLALSGYERQMGHCDLRSSVIGGRPG